MGPASGVGGVWFLLVAWAWPASVGPVLARGRPPDPVKHAFVDSVAARDDRLVPTVHPTVPRELTLLWFAPAGPGGDNPALTRLSSAVELNRIGRHDAALSLLSPVRSLDGPVAHYSAYYAARFQLQRGRPDLARRHFAALAAAGPVGFLLEAATVGEAQAASASGDHGGAILAYDRLLARHPMAPDRVWFQLAAAAHAAGDRARAVSAFTQVYERFPLSRHAPEALAALSELRAIEPLVASNTRFRSESRRGELLFEANRYDEAGEVFQSLLAHASGSERDRIEVRRAVCHYFSKRYVAAIPVLRRLRNSPTVGEEARFFQMMSARALGDHGDFENLADIFLQTSADNPWGEETLNTLATHFIQQNRDDEADAAFRRLLKLFPTGRFADRASWKVGWRAYRRGNAAETVQVFERAAVALPRSTYRPAYLYWAARAREALGDRDTAVSRYTLVRTDYLHSYYGRLAGAALERHGVPVRASFAAGGGPTASGDAGVIPLPPNAPVIRLLLSAGLYDDAVHEVRYAQHRWGGTPALAATLAWIEHQRGDLLAGARSARRAYPQYLSAGGDELPSELAAVIFPVGYWRLIRDHAARHGLDPYVLAALVAQESGFIPDIRSAARAVGLMQLMPATAHRYARKLELKSFSPAALVRPDTNVALGTSYFADLLKEFGHLHLALASYNAGESRVRRWLAARPDLPPDEFVDDIPFPETQDYVRKILGAAENYRRIYGGRGATPSDPNRAIPSLASRRSQASSARSVALPGGNSSAASSRSVPSSLGAREPRRVTPHTRPRRSPSSPTPQTVRKTMRSSS